MRRDEVERVWAAADYAPTAARLEAAAAELILRLGRHCAQPGRVVDIGAGHGGLAARLAASGHRVVAVEPVLRMRQRGALVTGTGVQWRDALGEDTGLPDASADAIVSNFGAFLCDPATGPAEWARVLAPGGVLLMTAWDGRGFLAEMTRRMMGVLHPDGGGPAHMSWGDDAFVEAVLGEWFTRVEIEHLDLPWHFDSVAAGLRLYETGSPTHAFSFDRAGDRRDALAGELTAHLAECADPGTGRIASTTGYALITARR